MGINDDDSDGVGMSRMLITPSHEIFLLEYSMCVFGKNYEIKTDVYLF